MSDATPNESGGGGSQRATSTEQKIERVVEDRLRISRAARSIVNHVFPKHWSFLLGEIALYSFFVLIATGVYLTFFYEPSLGTTTYEGSYDPMRGVTVSRAYDSALRISWDVKAGLLIRQIHHWAALVFVAAIVAHLLRNFFTGAYRRPREINWIVGVTLLILAIFNGFAGYSLLDDLLSGTGLRVGYSIALAVPVVGTSIAFLLFGGEFPASDLLSRLFIVHVLIIPAAIVLLVTIHLAIVWRQRHTQMPGEGRTDEVVHGTALWPMYAAKSVGLMMLIVAVLCALGALVQINPIWLYGPYEPAAVTTASQPDWYMGWIEGAMRLAGPWAFDLGPYYVSELFIPALLLPAVTFGLLYAWPFIDRWFTGDRAPHQVLDRPSDRPVRTAVGVAVLTLYGVLFVAGSQDIIASYLEVPLNGVLWTLRIAAIVLPIVAGVVAFTVARNLRARREWAAHVEERDELAAIRSRVKAQQRV